MENLKGNANKLIFIIIFLLLVISIFLSIKIFMTVQKYNTLIFPNVIVEETNIGNLTKEDAAKLLKEEYTNKLLSKKIIVKINNSEYALDYSELDIKINTDDVVNQAYLIGHNENFLTKYKLIKDAPLKHIPLNLYYNVNPIKSLVDQLYDNTFINSKNASIRRENGRFIVTPEVVGKYINKEELTSKIVSKINVDTKMNTTVTATIHNIYPEFTSKYLKQINTNISSYTTRFVGSSNERIHNIELATKSINGVVIHPNQEFSFNKTVGDRTIERGYKESKVIVNNKYIPGVGGGICQVSSTLYNAVLQSNIPFTERLHHTLPSSYVPIGLDATISADVKDFKFVNTLPCPIYIEGYCKNNTLSFNIYSDKSLSEIKYRVISKIVKTIQNNTKTINDPLLASGTEEVEIVGTKGYHVEVYLKGYKNGKEVCNKLLYKDIYEPVDKVVRIGTAPNYHSQENKE